ncbi:hypothetical protein ES332_A05G325500v1 [Gossypium tomentosum]|uniref:Uncharacterized protein n=1 Tax=Gossypium tomentosum TaxID=34277 RepID=A0A5D2QQE5_GOSTO|nr:hypothetical protein ES332_A05G325500v1 [Gossypium tomentosum]
MMTSPPISMTRDVGNVGPIFAFLLFITFLQQRTLYNVQTRKRGRQHVWRHGLELGTIPYQQIAKRGEVLKPLILQNHGRRQL